MSDDASSEMFELGVENGMALWCLGWQVQIPVVVGKEPWIPFGVEVVLALDPNKTVSF